VSSWGSSGPEDVKLSWKKGAGGFSRQEADPEGQAKVAHAPVSGCGEMKVGAHRRSIRNDGWGRGPACHSLSSWERHC